MLMAEAAIRREKRVQRNNDIRSARVCEILANTFWKKRNGEMFTISDFVPSDEKVEKRAEPDLSEGEMLVLVADHNRRVKRGEA